MHFYRKFSAFSNKFFTFEDNFPQEKLATREAKVECLASSGEVLLLSITVIKASLPLHPGRLFGSLPLTPPPHPTPLTAEAKLTVLGREVSVRWMRMCKTADSRGSIQQPSENIPLAIVRLVSDASGYIQRSGWTADGFSRFEAVYERPSKREIK